MKRFNRKHFRQLCLHLALIFASIIALYPILWTFMSSLKTDAEFFENIFMPPAVPQFMNYVSAWTMARMGAAFFNSLYISFFTVLLVVIISTLASFAFARDKSRLMKFFYIAFIAAIMIPPDVLFLTMFFQLRDLGLINNRWGVIYPSVSLGIPLSIFILTNYIKDLPQELFDSATIDGCSRFRLLSHITVPLISAPLGAVVIFQFTGIWNSFMLPLVILRSNELRVLPQVLNAFVGQFNIQYTGLFAGIMITFFPILIVFIFFSKSFMQGMTQGAIKG